MMKKMFLCWSSLAALFALAGCSSVEKPRYERPPQPTVNCYVFVVDKQQGFEYRHKKHEGGAGYCEKCGSLLNSSHRKQRGRTAPNRALMEKPGK